ncbi:MAG: hypothetical protein R3F37_13095 [Candidatus Competibacteraceae bacterium]
MGDACLLHCTVSVFPAAAPSGGTSFLHRDRPEIAEYTLTNSSLLKKRCSVLSTA